MLFQHTAARRQLRPAYGLHGQTLHAGRLVFVHPMTGETMDIQCPWPVWFETLLDGL